MFALNNPATIGETYLVADSKPITVGEILTILRKMQGRSLTTIYVPKVIIRFSMMMCGRADLWSRLRIWLSILASLKRRVGAPLLTHMGAFSE